MLIARPTDPDVPNGGFTVVDGFSRIVRLGEGLGETGALSREAMDRTIEALTVCAGKIAARGARHKRCVTTEACRQAANSDAFIERVERETGLALEIVSPEREAELTLIGCVPLLNTGHERALIFDIGGGSTEVQWVDIPRKGSGDVPTAIDVMSLPVGVVTLAERYGTGAMTEETHAAIVSEIAIHLDAFTDRNGIDAHIAAGAVQMLGTSGTVTTLGALHLGLGRYDRSRVDGLTVDFKSLRALSAELSELDFEARRRIPCIGHGRADLMLMGCALLGGICNRWPVGKLRIADRGIREGLLNEMMRPPQSVADAETEAEPLSVLPAARAF